MLHFMGIVAPESSALFGLLLLVALGVIMIFWAASMQTTVYTAAMNLMAVAVADGKLEDKELALVAFVAKQLGLNPKKLEKIWNKAVAEGKYEVKVPEEMSDREAIVKMMVAVMLVDGKISPAELAVVNNTANQFGVSPAFVEEAIKNPFK